MEEVDAMMGYAGAHDDTSSILHPMVNLLPDLVRNLVLDLVLQNFAFVNNQTYYRRKA